MKRITTFLYGTGVLAVLGHSALAGLTSTKNAPPLPPISLPPAVALPATASPAAVALVSDFRKVRFSFQQFEVGKKIVALGDKNVLSEMDSLLKADDREVRMNAGYVLAKMGEERGFLAVLAELTDTSHRPINPDEVRGNDTSQESQIVHHHYYAAYMLQHIGDKRAVPALIKALDDQDINYEAAIALGHLGDKSAIDPLRQLLAKINGGFQTRHNVKDSIAYGLMWLGTEDGFQLVLDELKPEYHWAIRRNAALYLGEYGDKRAVPALIQACRDMQLEVRRAAKTALGQMGDPSALPVLRALPAEPGDTPEHANEDTAKAIAAIEAKTKAKVIAVEATATNETAVKAANNATAPQDAQQRQDDAKKLMEQMRGLNMQFAPGGPSDGRPNPVEQHKQKILAELYKLGDDAVPAIAAALSDRAVQMRRNATLVLGYASFSYGPQKPSLNIRPALPALIKATTDTDTDVRAWAASAIGNIGPAATAAIPALIKLLTDPHEGPRNDSCLALYDIGPTAKAALPALRKLLNDPSKDTRQFATRAIEKIEK